MGSAITPAHTGADTASPGGRFARAAKAPAPAAPADPAAAGVPAVAAPVERRRRVLRARPREAAVVGWLRSFGDRSGSGR